ncbi:MAG: prepilin-type N-terminal cleavage/methylation domain-containing protein [Anaerolineae bacterium]|nr:prepilin-type N-terminal cleavage/methylation domain-containing protein [Anaerolineae bacterium]
MKRRGPDSRQDGFTLMELAIVLTIITILAVAILKSQSVVDQAVVAEAVASIKDLRAAAAAFRQRYRYLPGDFPVDGGIPEIPGVQAACRMGGANAGNGNGSIEPGESACASEHLIRADLVKGDPQLAIQNRQGAIWLVRAADSGALAAFSAPVQNVLVLSNIPCDMALEIDRKIDDGNLSSGTVRASQDNAFCTAAGNQKAILASLAAAL